MRGTALPYGSGMNTIIETGSFTAKAESLLTESQYDELVTHLSKHPESGVIIPGTGGIRKIRRAGKSGGKCGGVRVIYFIKDRNEIWLIAIYGKSERETIPPHDLKRIKEAACER